VARQHRPRHRRDHTRHRRAVRLARRPDPDRHRMESGAQRAARCRHGGARQHGAPTDRRAAHAAQLQPGSDVVEPPRASLLDRRSVLMPQRLNWRRGILVGASLISALILIAIIAVLVLTGTDWGRERVRRFAQNQINGMIHGKATIGRLSGNLLVGMTVHDLAITDSAGEPFVAVESFKANYDILGLVFRKHIWIEDAVLVRPLIVLDRPPGGKWNWQRIFVRSTAPTPPNQPPSWGAWLRFTNAAVVNGQLIVRTPWTPNANLSATQRDSAIRDVLGGGSRLMVQRAAGGFQKIIQLDSVTGAFPLVRLSDPGQPYRLLEVSALAMHAFPFRPPGAVVLDLKGVFPFTNDSIWWKGVYAALPGT